MAKDLIAQELQDHPEVFPQAGNVEYLNPEDFADFDGRAEMFARWHAQFTDGIMPTRGIDPDSLGVAPHDMDSGFVMIGLDALKAASKDPYITAHDGFLYGTRDETVFGVIPGAGMAFVQDREPNPSEHFRTMDGLEDDEDGHTNTRKHAAVAVRKIYNAEGMEKFASYLAVNASEIVDQAFAAGSFDAAEFATVIPRRTIGDMFGIPEENRQGVSDLGQKALLFQDPDIASKGDEQIGGALALYEYFENKAKRQTDVDGVRDEFITFYEQLMQINSELDVDARFNDTQIANMMVMLAAAGNETSRNAIAMGIYALATHPEQRDELAALKPGDEGYDAKWNNAVDEILRWSSPVIGFARRAITDTKVGGVAVANNTPVMLMYAAANRDPRVFDDPDKFDINRPNANDHVAFGAPSRHYCMGATLAKYQVKAVLQEVLTRMPDIELDGELDLAESNYVTSVQSLPVKSDLALAA